MRVPLLLIAALSLILTATGGATESETTRYVAADGRTMIWCSADGHSLVESPECAGAEANNAVNGLTGDEREAFGIGGFVMEYDSEDLLQPILVVPQDDLTGSSVYMTLAGPFSESTGERSVSEGCGPQVVALPADPVGPIMGWIPVLGLTDDLEVCAATTGTV